ncbi:unnamed protein product [Prorocentrum cordatum]|uniref:Uncharacterized protein n=1 Tax=Prorocentrum cordatum TaxID=2364126 RepID=A0ABN9VT38_9DINO|nr:unnamed protein product [Polarella glacialis]
MLKTYRSVEPTIFVLRANVLVSRGAVQALSRQWTTQCNVGEQQWEIQGDPSCKRFLLKFKGAANYASRLVNQTLALLRSEAPCGAWTEAAWRGAGPLACGSESWARQVAVHGRA